MSHSIYVVGTYDTKAQEIDYVADIIRSLGKPIRIVSISTTEEDDPVAVPSGRVADHHAAGRGAVFTGDRGSATKAMAEAFKAFLVAQTDVAAIIGLGGSGGTGMITPAMQALPVGTPKLMVSTMAAGDVGSYVGPSDITMMNSVTDIAGINQISEKVLGNAAYAVAGMADRKPTGTQYDKPAIGLTMFGVTTPCVTQCTDDLQSHYECLVFHATGIGGQSMEKLADSGLIAGVLDLTTTEVVDHLFGGVLAATEDRFGAIARTGIPYVGSVGALDMINFGGPATVPDQHQNRMLYEHNPQVTLMRTTAAENVRAGAWIAEKLNACEGPVTFLIPEKGVSMLDAPDMAFHDPAADKALFDALADTLVQTERRRLITLPYHINDPEFSAVACAEFRSLMER